MSTGDIDFFIVKNKGEPYIITGTFNKSLLRSFKMAAIFNWGNKGQFPPRLRQNVGKWNGGAEARQLAYPWWTGCNMLSYKWTCYNARYVDKMGLTLSTNNQHHASTVYNNGCKICKISSI